MKRAVIASVPWVCSLMKRAVSLGMEISRLLASKRREFGISFLEVVDMIIMSDDTPGWYTVIKYIEMEL